MPDEDQQKKKLAVLRRIVKWIGLTVLCLLLIIALIFQAPWKVIILLVIFLLACTILPRAYKKWFWLSAGAVVLILIVWVFLPDTDGDWRAYTFDEDLAVFQAKYAIPERTPMVPTSLCNTKEFSLSA